MAKAVSTQNNEPKTIRQMVDQMQPEFAKALPAHISVDRFTRTAQTAISMTRNIERVKDHRSLMAACTNAAADGLILDGREAALVIDYNGVAQYRPMMRGLLKLAYNSELVNSISVQVVCGGDEFEYLLGDEEKVTHKIDFKEQRGDPYAVYAIATLKNGAIIREVMTVAQINEIRDRSDAYRAFKSKKIKSTPWSTDWAEMARKTVFRRLSKYLPSSTERDSLHQAAERIDDDYSFEIEQEEASGNAPASTKKRRGAGAETLKNITPNEQKPQNVVDETPVDEPHDPETGVVIEQDDPGFQPGDDI